MLHEPIAWALKGALFLGGQIDQAPMLPDIIGVMPQAVYAPSLSVTDTCPGCGFTADIRFVSWWNDAGWGYNTHTWLLDKNDDVAEPLEDPPGIYGPGGNLLGYIDGVWTANGQDGVCVIHETSPGLSECIQQTTCSGEAVIEFEDAGGLNWRVTGKDSHLLNAANGMFVIDGNPQPGPSTLNGTISGSTDPNNGIPDADPADCGQMWRHRWDVEYQHPVTGDWKGCGTIEMLLRCDFCAANL